MANVEGGTHRPGCRLKLFTRRSQDAINGQEFAVDIAMPEQRRFSPRMRLPYTARLWSTDAAGRKWKEDTVLDNISTGGLYLRLNRRVREGAPVHVVVCLSTAAGEGPPRLRLAAQGLVLRSEPQPDNTWGVAVEFSRRRVL